MAPLVIPVRHHSPACARMVRAMIRERRPRVVLVEGPADASPLISTLLDPATRPPVALMAYFRAGHHASAASAPGSTPDHHATLFYPFCDYSPEWVAIQEGHACSAEVRFCDLPAGHMLQAAAASTSLPEPAPQTMAEQVAHRFGYGSHEEWWEAVFEAPPHPPAVLRSLMLAYGEEVAGKSDPMTELREAAMWQAVMSQLQAGVPEEEIVLVCGAAHAARLPPRTLLAPRIPRSPAVEFALTPYTFAHLAKRAGYGAGNRTPLFWQRAWETGSLSRASASCLAEAAAHLRATGWDASTADVISAYATAAQLAGLRNKAAPGAEEVRLAASSVWSDAYIPALEPAIEDALIGSTAGTVAVGIGEPPLTADFFARARRYWRKIDATEREERLRLTIPAEAEKSHFLHQLRIAGIPFARLRDSSFQTEPGAALRSRYEVWVRSWTPQTAIRLAEQAPLGATVFEVARAALVEALQREAGLERAVQLLMDAALAGLEDLLDTCLNRVDAASLFEMPWEELARSTARVTRVEGDTGLPLPVREASAALAGRLYTRCCLHLPVASRCTPERAPAMGAALMELHETALASSLSSDLWHVALRGLQDSESAQPYLRGLAVSLLQSLALLPAGEMERMAQRLLSAGSPAPDAAAFIEGLLALNREILLRSPGLARSLNGFLAFLDDSQFLEVLPILRRTFSSLSPAEMRVFVRALRPQLQAPAQAHDPAAADWRQSAADARILLRQILDEGFAAAPPALTSLSGLVSSIASGPSPSAQLAAGHLSDLLAAGDPKLAAHSLLSAWAALEALRLDGSAAPRRQPPAPLPGLSFICQPRDRGAVPRARGAEWEESLLAALTDDRPSTRPDRVALIAAALQDPVRDTAEALFPLVAHGDYTALITRAFSQRPDAGALARRGAQARNPLLRRAALALFLEGSASLPAASSASAAPVAFLSDETLWPEALRRLRARPAAALNWVLAFHPSPDEVGAGSEDETRLARLARAFARCPAAGNWLRSCLGGPDRLATSAAASLAQLGQFSTDELRWSAGVRGEPWGPQAVRRYEIESGERPLPSLLLEEPDAELIAGLPEPAIDWLVTRLSTAGDRSEQAMLVDLLGGSRSARAVSVLCPIVEAGHPLLASSAAGALGAIGHPSAVGCLLARSAPRGSDADQAVLAALARIGDLRVTGLLARRLRNVRPEEVGDSEIRLLRSLGEALILALPPWLEDGSPTLRAVAELLLGEEAPEALGRWAARQAPEERLRQLCSVILLPGGASPVREDALVSVASTLGSAAAATLVNGLKVASGGAEAAMVRVLEGARLPSSVLPLLRLSRRAPWKQAILCAIGEEAVPQLRLALEDAEKHVAQAAREALTEIGADVAPLAEQPTNTPRRGRPRH